MKSLATAYWQSEVTYSLTKMGFFDAVGKAGAEGVGVSCKEVASGLSLDEDFACRMMLAGEGIKLLTRQGEGSFSLTPAGDMIRSNHPASLRSVVLMLNEETRDAWRKVGTASLESGVSGFKEEFGEEFWSWHSKKGNRGKMSQFDNAMRAFSHEIAGSLLVDWAPPTPSSTVCDIGGSKGHMVGAMAQHYPELNGVVFDVPIVAKSAEANLEEMGLSQRVKAIGGSFLESLPAELSDCDAFYMKFILHDWDDETCVKIIKNINAVAKEGAVIVSTDFILNVDGPAMEMNKRLMDINMMAANPTGARERTFQEYSALFKAAGLTAEPQLLKQRDLVSTVVVEI